jgi:hypothetical protein
MDNHRTHSAAALALAASLAGSGGVVTAEETAVLRERIAEVVDVEPVGAAHPVGFCLLTRPPNQFIAYYDAQRQMTVAQRRRGQPDWTVQKLPSRLGWDSHNYVTMALDSAGHLHLSGNMHCVPLVYYRSTRPGDVTSLVQIPTMVASDVEQRVTYPCSLNGPDGAVTDGQRPGRHHAGGRTVVFSGCGALEPALSLAAGLSGIRGSCTWSDCLPTIG